MSGEHNIVPIIQNNRIYVNNPHSYTKLQELLVIIHNIGHIAL